MTAPPSASPPLLLRPPTGTSLAPPSSFTAPTPTWLAGTWHVTHSSLPMWKTARNVSITYTPLPISSSAGTASPMKIDDVVTYQSLSSNKIKTVHGVDTAAGEGDIGGWDWKGKGWLWIARSHWEVLGWGDDSSPSSPSNPGNDEGNQWAVTYFAKTLFTPAGIDVYSRRKEGVTEEVLEGIKRALGEMEDEGLRGLVGGLFEVGRD